MEMKTCPTVKIYIVQVEWDATGWWFVTVPTIPGAVTQSSCLDQVRDDVAEVIKLMTGEDPDAYEIDLRWRVLVDAGTKTQEVHDLRAEADRACIRLSEEVVPE